MSKLQQKPILHGRDHRPGGVDPIPGIGGIAFDTYPQAGNWLYIETDDETGAGGSPSGLGLELDDFSAGGISIGAMGGGDLELKATGGGDLNFHTTGGASLTGNGVTLLATGASGSNLSLTAHGGEALLRASSQAFATTDVRIYDGDSDMSVRVASHQVSVTDDSLATTLLLIDNTVSGSPTYHIPAGTSWVADL